MSWRSALYALRKRGLAISPLGHRTYLLVVRGSIAFAVSRFDLIRLALQNREVPA